MATSIVAQTDLQRKCAAARAAAQIRATSATHQTRQTRRAAWEAELSEYHANQAAHTAAVLARRAAATW